MTLDELNAVDVNNPAQVKALQNFLKSRGYYNGALDGKWGGGTVEGVKALRTDLRNDAATQRDTAVAGAEAEKAKSSWGRYAQEMGPYAGGLTSGVLAGVATGRANKKADIALADDVATMPGNKRISPVQAEASMDKALARRNYRSGSLAIGAGIGFGGAELTRRYIKPQMPDELKPMADIAASAEQGFGMGAGMMAAKGAISDALGKSPIPPSMVAEIRSRAAEARGDPYTISKPKAGTPPPAGPDPARLAELRAKRVADLKAEAKAAGLHVSGTKDDLARRIAEAPSASPAPKGRLPRGKPGLLAPLVAGGVAYDAATGEAEAAGVDPENARRRGIVAGAGAAGLTVGASKLAPYVIDAISKTPLGRVAARAFPPAAAAMTAYDVGSMAVDENAKPDTMLEGPETGRMPETPGNPHFFARQQALARQTRGEAPLRSAAALEMPEGDDFDAQLAAFMQAVEEHNAGVGGQEYGP